MINLNFVVLNLSESTHLYLLIYMFYLYRSYLFIVTFVLLYQGVFAQNIVVKNLPTQRFLPSANMHHVVRDSEGYMWYATEDGLCRDNGYQVDVFRSDDRTPDYWPSNHVVDLVVGKDNKIWVATEAGLYFLDKKDYKLRQVKGDSFPSDRINHLDVTRDGSVWVMAARRVVRLTAEGEVARVYEATNAGNGKKFVNCVYEDSRGRYWLYECQGGIRRYDKATDSFVPCRWDCPCEPHGGFYEDVAHGCIWVSTWGMGVVKYVLGANDGAHRVEYQPCTYQGKTLDESKGKIISMSSDGKTLWCSAMDGFYAYDIQEDGTLSPHSTESLVPSGKKVFAASFLDAENNVWVASYSPRTFILCRQDEGVTHCAFPSVQAHTGMEMIAENLVEDTEGWVWLWHLRFGLMLWNPVTDECRIVLETQRVPGSRILVRRNDGGVWSCEGTKVVMLWREAGRVASRDVVDVGKEVRCLLDDGQGHLWIATSDAIFSYDLSTQKLRKRAASNGVVTAMKWSDERQCLYFITPRSGLNVLDVVRGKVRKVKGDNDHDFTALAVSSHGNVWLGSRLGGVFFYDAASDSVKRDADASFSDGGAVIDMTVDSIGHLWVVACKCVKEYSPKRKTFRMFWVGDAGIGLDYFLSLGHFGGRVCVGGAGGLCQFSPTMQLDRHSRVRPPLFSSVVVDGKKHLFGLEEHEWAIAPDEVSVAVSFSTLNHLNADRISYAYRLYRRGEKAAPWTYLPQGQNTAYFAALEQGYYVLDVKATDIYGNWGEDVASLSIVRKPAWWETWWMRLLYILAGAGVVACILYFYFRNRIQRMEIEKLVALAQGMRVQRERQQNAVGLAAEQGGAQPEGEAADVSQKVERVERALSKGDMKFLRMAKERVEKNIDNPDYTAEQFASDLFMSRMSLYRKMQRTTQQTPTEFIRMVRLTVAAEMLRTDDLPIAEVASRTGFATPSYFTKCFKAAFGVLPGEYRKR